MRNRPSIYGYSDLNNLNRWKVEMMVHFRRDIVGQPVEMIYGDTDSVMVKFGDGISIDRSLYLGLRASHMVTQHFEKPNLLECEAVKCPAIFINKKRYIALEREIVDDALKPGKIKVQGETGKRRDNFKLIAELQNPC